LYLIFFKIVEIDAGIFDKRKISAALINENFIVNIGVLKDMKNVLLKKTTF
jgi:hypothetical protein